MKLKGLLWGLSLCALSVNAAPGELTFAADQLQAKHHAKVSRTSNGIELETNTPEWSSGLQIMPPKGKKFDFSGARFLAVDVTNLSKTRQMRLTMHISSGNQEKKSTTHVDDIPLREINTGIGLNPGETRTMRLYLPHASLFTAPKDGKNFRRPLDTAKINMIEFKIQWPFEAGFNGLLDCRLSKFRLEGEPEIGRKVNPASYFPFIDPYGQYIHYDWPEKIHSDKDLVKQHKLELEALKNTETPSTWDKYGGWAKGPKLKATGYFRVEKYDKKWYFVDPEGHLFWSFGIDVLRTHTDAIDGKKHPQWFSSKLPADGMMPFTHWNLQKKYGKANYSADFYNILVMRLRAWGINTIGNWGSPEFMDMGKMPYTLSLGQLIKGCPRLGAKIYFYDVFAPEFEKNMGNLLKTRAAEDPRIAKSIKDPMCIGYFIDNELKFNDIVKGVMTGPATQHSKVQFIRDLRAKYKEIADLNKAWETKYADWESLAKSTDIPKNEAFQKDAADFNKKVVNRYFEICRKGIKSVAPHRLYLGCRFVGFRQSGFIWEAATKYCDVVSVNTYSNSIFNTNRGDFRDRPIIVGEFHFGTYDRGMFSSSLCPVGDQKERATSLTRFVQGGLGHPNFVGVHYFQFRDQPLTGRFDGEGYQIGFVDVADTPYPEMTRAAREIGENMYDYRNEGKLRNEMK